MNAKVVFFMVN